MKTNCIVCNKSFNVKRKGHLYCSELCRSRAKRERHREKFREDHKKYYKNNKEKIRISGKKYRKKGHNTYSHILRRCNNPKLPSYKTYGGKGIKCKISRKDFVEFYNLTDNCQICQKELIPNSPDRSISKTVDRINGNGHYELGNIQILCSSCNTRKNKKNFRIGFKSGRWEILHGGHILSLKKSKELCDHLIVLIHNCDKKPSYINIEERKIIIESIKYVDECYIYNEDTEDKFIEDFVKNRFFRFGPNAKLIIFHSEELRGIDKYIPGSKYANAVYFINRKFKSTSEIIDNIIRDRVV
jgi:cytidyltransferase-like protein